MLPRLLSAARPAVVLALALAATAATAQTPVPGGGRDCIVAGAARVMSVEATCPGNAFAVLSSLRHERQVPRLDARGLVMLDPQTGLPMMDSVTDTYGRFLELAELAGAGPLLQGDEPHTVLAVSDRALGDSYDDLKAALTSGDAARTLAAQQVVLHHFFDEPVWAEYFSSSSGKIWTKAGTWRDGGTPIAFNYASSSGPVIGGRHPLRHDVPASNAVIHLVDGLLADSK
ncbi:fasciclin domain-containing protein [Caenispirillum bisanense]|uniref:fasciclin domain-containing protein n=1 Tax=Caenispirillum bisanense TaxID=414052 RepID=UPI0031D75530